MASEKKPSIYQDRGTIGSAKELDEYGVWVKSEPQDLAGDDKDTAGGDFFLDSLDDLPDFPSDLDTSSGPDSDSADSDFSIPEDEFNLDGGDESSGFSFGSEDSSAGNGEFSPENDNSITGFSLDDEDLDFSLPEAAAEDAPSQDDSAESPAPDEDSGFDEISLEDLLDVADDFPDDGAQEADAQEEGEDNEAGSVNEDLGGGSADKSTRLLMKIADELSSIRAELSALKQEFSAAHETAGGGGESHGFFSDADTDDKIALTGDELNNILNTAEFTEESGINAAEEDLLSGFSEGDAAPADVSPQAETPEAEAAAESPAEELSLDDLDIAEDSVTELSLDELSLDDLDISEDPGLEVATEAAAESSLDELSLDDLDIAEDSGAELSLDELSLDDLDIAEEPLIEEVELSAGAEESVETGAGQPEELGAESLDDSELSLVDLSDDSINADFSVEENPAEDGTAGDELSLADPEIILEEPAKDEAEDLGEPEIALDTAFSDEEISLDNFEEEALDLSGAVIEEPDLGAEIRENPIQEPSDIDTIEDIAAPGEDGGPPEEIDEIEEIDDEAEISGEGAADISPAGGAGSRGEDLDQIIPEGFVVGEPDDEGDAGFGTLEEGISEEGISLDEIPEAELPEEEDGAEKPADTGAPDEPDVSALPGNFKTELKQVLSYMDQLLESLPEEKIEEFAKSEYFDTYKKLFKELGLA